MSKNIKTRIQHKYDIEANWLQATGFIPLAGELIVYECDETHSVPRLKIGDGKTPVNDLNFIDAILSSYLIAHIENTESHITEDERTAWFAAKSHADSDHAPVNAEKNQNAFSSVLVDNKTISAASATDSLTIAAGDNIVITPDELNNKIIVNAVDTVYTHPTASGNKHIPSGGQAGQILRWADEGTATWGTDIDTTYTAGSGIDISGTVINNAGVRSVSTGSSNGTISVNTGGKTVNVTVKGLGSAAYTNTTAYEQNGAVSAHNIATDTHSDIRALIVGLTTRLNTLADSDDATLDQMSEIVAYIKNNASLIEGITTTKVNVSDIINNLTTNVVNQPLSAAQGVVIKSLIDALSSELATHDHNYAGSSSAGGAADSANKLNTNAGSTVNPVYFANGVPVQTTYKLEKSVPANAVFTDTVYTHPSYTPSASGLYKITVDNTGHISNTTAVTKADITALGIADSQTSVSFTQGLTSGTKVGTLTINGANTDLFAPTNTDTHYTSKNVVGSASATSNTTTALSNGNVYLNSVENGAVTSAHKISGTGATTVTTDTAGNIIINSTDNNTDTKVTSVDNHYLPVADSTVALTAQAAGSTQAQWNTTSLVTGVNLQRDSKGHVTGIMVDSIKMPVNPDTDTHYTTGLKVGASSAAAANAAASNGSVYLNVLDNSTVRDSHKIVGAGATTVTSDANGVITISSTDSNTTYTTGTNTASGLTKLYTSSGTNADGAMTQKATTAAINELISCGTTDPNASTTSRFYFKYATD